MKKSLPHSGIMIAVFTSAGFASLGLLGGLGLQTVEGSLLAFLPLFIALPAMNAMAGDYATIIAAHMGDPQMQARAFKKMFLALAVALPISIIGVSAMSLVVAHLKDFEITTLVIQQHTIFVALALVGVVSLTVATGFILNRVFAKRQVNSDDVLIPVANTLASVMMLVCFTVAATMFFG